MKKLMKIAPTRVTYGATIITTKRKTEQKNERACHDEAKKFGMATMNSHSQLFSSKIH